MRLNTVTRQGHTQTGRDGCETHFAEELWPCLLVRAFFLGSRWPWAERVLAAVLASRGITGALSLVGCQRPKTQKHTCFLPLLMCLVSTSKPGPDTRVHHASALVGSAMNAGWAGSSARALASWGVFSYGSLPGKDLLDNFKRMLPSMIMVKLKLVMVRFLANPPLRRGAKHSLCMCHEQASTAPATDLAEAWGMCGGPRPFLEWGRTQRSWLL